MKTMFARLLGLCLLLAWVLPASAEEYISSYHSIVDVAKDGTLTVTEAITARAEGDRIKRGIFRDFPLYALDKDGNRTKVGFKVLSVERDGAPEDWHTENIDGGIRIYTGNADRLLPTGEHIFQITYTTDRQIRYFDSYDELTWNVTGNGWQFPMREISATISLPKGARPTDTAVFTGKLGATGKDARILTEGNDVFFASTRPFYPGEGMTVAVKLPKGVLDAPSASQEWEWWLRDRLALIIAGLGLLIVLAYYYRAWAAVGRDPAAGVIVPRWHSPEGLSPALVNYVDGRGFADGGWTALSATALDLAVKGFVTIEDLKNGLIIRRTEKKIEDSLPVGQRTLLSSIGASGNSLTIDKANGETVQKVGSDFRSSIEKEHRGKYYRSNSGYIVGGLVLSFGVIVATLIFGSFDEGDIGTIISLSMAAVFFAVSATIYGKQRRRGRGVLSRLGGIVFMAISGFLIFSLIAGVVGRIFFDHVHDANTLAVVALALIVLLNVLFVLVMGAPTPLGRQLMDAIGGLRLYLTVAEKDRMNMQGAPQMSPQHFETLLPYAVALGVEKPWSKAFETWLAAASAGAAAYAPTWYNGNYNSFGDRIGGFSSSMASTIASTIPAPPSSSSSSFSGGGGSSGSGGGGGGGGGW
ncbi:UNVERIFIED_ORG: putative membrane protein YgcG [Agrobacterium larrymoorei]|nr:putative membrane protein YgcG [Agrobacterium larrymoorei]